MLDLLVIVLLQAVAGDPAATPSQTPTEQTVSTTPAETTEPAPADRVVCRTEETTSSRVRPRRVCLSQNDRARLNRENRREMDDAGRHGGPGRRCGAGAPC